MQQISVAIHNYHNVKISFITKIQLGKFPIKFFTTIYSNSAPNLQHLITRIQFASLFQPL